MTPHALAFLGLLLCVCAVSLYERLRDGRLVLVGEEGRRGPDDAVLVDWVRRRAAFLHPLAKHIPVIAGACAYCENRAVIYLRTRRAAPPHEPYTKEELLYVYTHELAHVLADEEPGGGEHGPAFERTFRALLARGVDGGLYPAGFAVPDDYTDGC